MLHKLIFSIFLFSSLMISLSFSAGPEILTYQRLISECDRSLTPCVILTRNVNYQDGSQGPVRGGDQLNCISNYQNNQACTYREKAEVTIGCGGSKMNVQFKGLDTNPTITYSGLSTDFAPFWKQTTSLYVNCAVKR